MTKALVPLAEGAEEMEFVIIVDMLRRAGWTVVTAAVGQRSITASRGVGLIADEMWDDIDPASFDILVIPGGGGGTERLADDQRVLEAVRQFHAEGKTIAAVCAGPIVLEKAGVLAGITATCHPAAAGEIPSANRVDEIVVTDGNIVTSQGPGTSFEFALELIRRVDGEKAAQDIARAALIS